MAQGITSTFEKPKAASFWKDSNQMGVTKANLVAALKDKVIKEVEYLQKFNKDHIEGMFEVLRKPPEKIEAVKLVLTAPYVISAKSKKHIQIAAIAMRYCKQTGRNLMASNMMWSTLKSFGVQ